MSGYLAIDFYFWTASYHLLVDFGPEPRRRADTGPVGPRDERRGQRRQLTFTYTIKDGINWSDGEPLTAEDVAFTLNLYKRNHAYLPQNYLTLIDGDVERVDDTTHPVPHEAADRPVLGQGRRTCTTTSCPSTSSRGRREAEAVRERAATSAAGPFIITEYKVGEYVRMEQQPVLDRPGAGRRRAHLPDLQERGRARRGAEAGRDRLRLLHVREHLQRPSQGQPNIETMAGTIPSFSEIGMNTGSAYQAKTDTFTPHGDGHPALTDVTVRRAIRMAIDSTDADREGAPRVRRPGRHDHPAGVRGGREVGADRRRGDPVRHRGREQVARGRRLQGHRRRRRPRDAAGSLDPGRPLEFRYYVRSNEQTSVDASQFVANVAEADRDQGRRRGRDVRTARRHHQRGHVRPVLWGWIPGPGPGLGALVVHVRPAAAGRQHLREQRLVLLQPRVRRDVRGAADDAGPRDAVGHRPRDAEDLLRGLPRTRSCGTTRSSRRGGATASRATSRSPARRATRSRAGAARAPSGGRSTRSVPAPRARRRTRGSRRRPGSASSSAS